MLSQITHRVGSWWRKGGWAGFGAFLFIYVVIVDCKHKHTDLFNFIMNIYVFVYISCLVESFGFKRFVIFKDHAVSGYFSEILSNNCQTEIMWRSCIYIYMKQNQYWLYNQVLKATRQTFFDDAACWVIMHTHRTYNGRAQTTSTRTAIREH